jgi:pimeloyl-ACP methyl ester carboxylesterase
VATFALIHGGGGSAWDWHLVLPELRKGGHEPVAVDLRYEDASAGWWEFADAVVRALGERQNVIVVSHSLGGFTAPLVCARVPVDLLVLVAKMIPSPGRALRRMVDERRLRGVGIRRRLLPRRPELAAEAKGRERGETSKALREPWPRAAWPETPTRYLPCRDDRMFTARWARRHAHRAPRHRGRRDGGRQLVMLSRPNEIAEHLDASARGTERRWGAPAAPLGKEDEVGILLVGKMTNEALPSIRTQLDGSILPEAWEQGEG